MIFLKFDNRNRLTYRHNFPFHEKHGLGKTEEQLVKEGVLVEQLPAKLPEAEGKIQELYYIEGQLEWQYEDIPPTPQEKENQKIAELETALLEMSTLSALQQAQNEQAIMELTMMIGGM